MAVNVYKNRLKSELSQLQIGESKVFSSEDIPYRYFRSNIHVVAAEIGMWFKCHSPRPYDKTEVKRVA